MNAQIEMFATTSSSPLIGMMVKLDRDIDRRDPCCQNLAVVTVGKGQHSAGLACASCGKHRGWVSKSTTLFLRKLIEHWGVPTEPLIVRESPHYFGEY